MKVVIDTNFWVSFLISHRQDRLDNLILIDRIRILFSAELLGEISETINKPKLKKYFGFKAFDDMLMNLDEYIDLIDVKSVVEICRDHKDDFLLALAKDGKADYLLSGDKDLLDLKKYGKTQIVTFTSFLDKESRNIL